MADLTQDSLLSSGDFKATECTGILNLASGASGTILTLSSTGGRKIRLTALYCTLPESGISVVADGVTVISSKTLTNSISSGFAIGLSQSHAGSFYQPAPIKHVEALNTITVTKASGSTANTIYYATEQGF